MSFVITELMLTEAFELQLVIGDFILITIKFKS